MSRAVVHPQPAAIIERRNERWSFHRVIDPRPLGIPHFDVEARS